MHSHPSSLSQKGEVYEHLSAAVSAAEEQPLMAEDASAIIHVREDAPSISPLRPVMGMSVSSTIMQVGCPVSLASERTAIFTASFLLTLRRMLRQKGQPSMR